MNGTLTLNRKKMPMMCTCNKCGSQETFFVVPDDVLKWQAGDGYIQDIFDYLTASERELMISKTCGECWNDMYKNWLEAGEEK